MNAFVGVMACGHPLRRPLQGRLVHARPFPFGKVAHVLCRTSSPQMWFASALAGFGVYVCVRVYVCCPPPFPPLTGVCSCRRTLTHTHTHTHPAGVRHAGDRKLGEITGFGPVRFIHALEQLETGGVALEPADTTTGVTPQIRLAEFAFKALMQVQHVKGLWQSSKEGLRTVCSDPALLWHEFVGDGCGWCLVRSPPPSPCLALTPTTAAHAASARACW